MTPNDLLTQVTDQLARWFSQPVGEPVVVTGVMVLTGLLCLEATRRTWRRRRNIHLLIWFGGVQLLGAWTANSQHAPQPTHLDLISSVLLLFILHSYTRERKR